MLASKQLVELTWSVNATTKTRTSPAINVETAIRMRTAIGRISRRLRLFHVDKDLSPSQRDVLGTIVRRGPIGLSDLAAEEGLNPTMLSRIAGHLEGRDLVTRIQDVRDGRAARLEATDSGRAKHEQMKTESTDALLRTMSTLSQKERRQLDEALPVLESLAEALRSRP